MRPKSNTLRPHDSTKAFIERAWMLRSRLSETMPDR